MKNILNILAFALLMGCHEKYPYKVGTFPEDQPINFTELNSEFDEMNSDYHPSHFSTSSELIFSSSAGSKGADFDLEARTLGFSQSKETYDFAFTVSSPLGTNHILRNQLFEINSDCDERGPYSFSSGSRPVFYRMYSKDCDGISQVFLNEFESKGQFEEYTTTTTQVQLIGQNANEMYPSFYGQNYLKGGEGESQGTPEKLLFSSDKDGAFDMYEIDLPVNQDLLGFLKSDREKSAKKIEINTSANDHMPFVYGDLLVFSSDRLGGYGGYDLYYAQKTASGWTEPVNFGPKINSTFDEYRPIVSDHPEFSNRLMIFSSDRPRGLGGFDLYFVGIPKL